jgi:hypothetical protein
MSETRVPAEMRREVEKRARGYCEYCRCPAAFTTGPFEVEHIHPESRGGPTELDNLAFSCSGCNGHKLAKTEGRDPETGAIVPLFHPRRQRWGDHFQWDESLTLLVGLNPTGRATIGELQLNREGVGNLRGALRALGAHPPPEPDQA